MIDKKVKKKTENQGSGDDTYYSSYLEYSIKIKGDHGKKKILKWKNNTTIYDYYEVGDQVRYHGQLKSFEKYDKSKDEIIFCKACFTKCNIVDEFCSRCKCPLLK